MINRDFVSGSSAVGLGALIGGLLSIEIASRFALGDFLWIFGALFGGFVAYVIVEFRQFCEGVTNAYKKTISWKPNVLFLKTCTVVVAGFSLAPFSIFMGTFGVLSFFENTMTVNLVLLFVKVSFFMALILGSLFSWAIIRRSPWMVGRKYTRHLLQVQKTGYWLLTRLNPISAPFTAAFYLGKGIVLLVKAIPKMVASAIRGGRAIAAFLVVALKNIHSQRRAVIFFDATVGAVTGYLLGSVLLGAVIGAVILYPLHRNLIAIRLLKTVPR